MLAAALNVVTRSVTQSAVNSQRER